MEFLQNTLGRRGEFFQGLANDGLGLRAALQFFQAQGERLAGMGQTELMGKAQFLRCRLIGRQIIGN